MPPRIRTLKPDIWQDRHLGRLPVGARLLFIGIITQADDEGRFRAELPLLRAAVFPFDDSIAGDTGALPGLFAELDIAGWLALLEQAGRTSERPGLVRLYEVKGERFGDLPTWSSHQRIDSPRPSKLPSIRQADKPMHRQQPATKGNGSRTTPEQTGDYAGDSGMPTGSLALDMEEEEKRRERHVDPHADRPLRSDIASVWQAYAIHHPGATFTTSGKNNRKGLIERALKTKPAAELIAAIHGIHSSAYHVDNGHARNLELTLRDADHIERYAAMADEVEATSPGESRLDRALRAQGGGGR